MITKEWWTTLEKILQFDEGVRYLPYDCGTGKTVLAPVGRITIGIGRNLQDKGISHDVALMMLREDIGDSIKAAETILGKEFFNNLSAPKQHGIVSMIFQLGPAGFAGFKNTIAAMNRGDWKDAGDLAKQSKWFKQTPERAGRVIAMFSEDKYHY